MAWLALFKVQHFHPARLRRARGDTSTHLGRDDVAITLFEVESVDLDKKVVITGGLPKTDKLDLSGALAVINASLFMCQVFRFKADHVEFNLPGIPGLDEGRLRTVARGLIDNEALPGRGMRYIVPPSANDAQQQLEVLQRLESMGLVSFWGASADAPGNAWAFTEEGVAFVHPVYHLRHPEFVLQPRHLGDKQEWSRYELIVFLQDRGWAMPAVCGRRLLS